jgi:hypothetical protein
VILNSFAMSTSAPPPSSNHLHPPHHWGSDRVILQPLLDAVLVDLGGTVVEAPPAPAPGGTTR